MKKMLLAIVFCVTTTCLHGMETFPVWPATPPGDQPEQYKGQGGEYDLPVFEWWSPEHKVSDVCIIICCGGAYMGLAYEYEGVMPRDYFLEHGVTVVMLRYRIPRRPGVPKHMAAWQDAQRTIRQVRSRSAEWGINPEKIGVLGFSAGGHLTLMAATTSETASYSPVDERDEISCHLNFAVPIYPAYVLDDGEDCENTKGGMDADFVPDFSFDTKTPPMCLIHGDGDTISPMGSVAVYRKLRAMNIPAELHIYTLADHAFRNCGPDAPVRRYPERVLDWLGTITPPGSDSPFYVPGK